MNNDISKKELLKNQIQQQISKNKQELEYLENYKAIMDIPTEELIAKHLVTGSRVVDNGGVDILDLNTELLIRLLLK